MNNIKLWFDQSEPDYYLYFLKAWIPFNAWYVVEYPKLKKRDKDIIQELQYNSESKVRKIIKNYLEDNKDHDSLLFQSYFAELHFQLEKNHISQNGFRVSFKCLQLQENPIKYKNLADENGNVYKSERTATFYQAYIEAKGGKVLLDYKNPIYDVNELQKDIDFIRLDSKIKDKIKTLFEEINPKKSISLIYSRKAKYLLLKSKNSCKIIEDTDIVSSGCIKVLYALRCMLFHGEITPNETHKAIYKNAYYLLYLIINKLK